MRAPISALLLVGGVSSFGSVPLTSLSQADLDGEWEVSSLEVPSSMNLSFTSFFVGSNEYRSYTLEDANEFDGSRVTVPIHTAGSLADIPSHGSGTQTVPCLLEANGRYVVNAGSMDSEFRFWINNDADVGISGHLLDSDRRWAFRTLLRPRADGVTSDLAGDWSVCTLQVPDDPFLTTVPDLPPAVRYSLNRASSAFFNAESNEIGITATGEVSQGGTPTGQSVSLASSGLITYDRGGGDLIELVLAAGGDCFAGVNPISESSPDDSWELVLGVKRPTSLRFADFEGSWIAVVLDGPNEIDLLELSLPNVFYPYLLENADAFHAAPLRLAFDDSGHFVLENLAGGDRETGSLALGATPGDVLIILDSGGLFPAVANARRNVLILTREERNEIELVVLLKQPPFLSAPDWGEIVFDRVSPNEIKVLIPDDGTMVYELEGSSDLETWTTLTTTAIPVGINRVLHTYSSASPLPDPYFVRVLSRIRSTP